MKVELRILKKEYRNQNIYHFYFAILDVYNKEFNISLRTNDFHDFYITDTICHNNKEFILYNINITKKQYELLTSNDIITQEMMFKIIINDYKDL